MKKITRKLMSNRQYGPKGSVLAVALIVLGIIVVIAISVSTVSIQERKGSIGASQSTAAFQNADSGIEKVMEDIFNQVPTAGVDTLSNCDLTSGFIEDTGKFKVELKDTSGNKIDCDDSSAILLDIASIKSTGISAQESRAIEAEISATGP